MTIALERPVGTTDPDTLVDPEVSERLASRITKDHPEIDASTARRIVGQTAAFLAAGAREPGQFLVPSALVDIGWHTWILHTVDYAEACQRIAGRFIHHVPTDADEMVPGGPAAARERTLAAITAAGYTVDPDLWVLANGDCTQCHAGCTDSPVNK
ncbi:glycine-rich domain-containing protein [Streptomyces sp. NPDC004520]|uniref:glycine-rich domain-containing protein n=1 Tax=Streptomyces sp. NPDC004520 TaxID=3364702 RepID=UPI0036BEB9E2